VLGVVDYGSGNLRSVTKALAAVGAQPRLVTSPAALAGIDAIVVPGVGAFGDCAKNLRATGLWDPLREWIASDRPYLGICLGYQLLFEASEETPGVAGLGALPGIVRRFPASGLKVPHMGWNTLDLRQPVDRLHVWVGEPRHGVVVTILLALHRGEVERDRPTRFSCLPVACPWQEPCRRSWASGGPSSRSRRRGNAA